MKKMVISTVLLLLVMAGSSLSVELSANTTESLTSMPLAFTENQGQWDAQVMFRADAAGATMWFSAEGAYYQFTRSIESDEAQDDPADPILDRLDHEPDSTETMMIKASFVGANLNPTMRGEDVLDYKCNYFIGNDPAGWRSDVSNYSAVVYEEVYTGIDLKYYGNGKEMEYDFIVSPGTDPSQIKIQYEGVESVSVNGDGELVVATQWGEVIERRPVVYQLQNDTRVPVDGQYRLIEDNSFGFSLGSDYDPTLPLVIDPVLSYSTYLGGSNGDWGYGIAVDATGAAYVMGYTGSTDFPTQNPLQGTLEGKRTDVFVTKLSADGTSLVYSTYLGGSESEFGSNIAVDAIGEAYVTGSTWSTDFPTLNPYQEVHQGGDLDAYIAKLSVGGNSLIYSTYLGGSGDDRGYDVAVDGAGAAYVTGFTTSTEFPTENGYQETYQGVGDAFVTKLSTDGNALVFSTFLGGSIDDWGYDIAVDEDGATYVTGQTQSDDFPIENGYQETFQGMNDVFVTKLSADGNSLIYSTYLGGSDIDMGWSIALDGTGAAYVTGPTSSTDFPTENWYQQSNMGGVDAFVTKLNADGNALIFSTYLGGSDGDFGAGIAVNTSGETYVTGHTSSKDFPTESGYQETNQGMHDAFVTKMSTGGNSLVYSTYLGGEHYDWGESIALDAVGASYVTGRTWSSDFPTECAYQETRMGTSYDAFVTKLVEEPTTYCQISGSVTANEIGLPGVTVDLYDNTSSIIAVSVTDETGTYSFDELFPGTYLVTMLTPFGFEAEVETITVEAVSGFYTVDFEVTEITELAGSQKTRGYWAHQANVLVSGLGQAEQTYEDMCVYLEEIRTHFVENIENPIEVVAITPTSTCDERLALLSDVLTQRQNPDDNQIARAHLAALLLNVVSASLSQMAVISDDGALVSQAITYSHDLIMDLAADNDDTAKVIAETINKGKVLPAGWIPLSTPHIMYKQGEGGLPGEFALHQNYPNPFNPATEISFSLPHASHTKLEIFNIVGQRVETLVDRRMQAGYHRVSFDGSKVASGVYLYRLQADEYVESKKMLLIK